jgi:hypothetical protein
MTINHPLAFKKLIRKTIIMEKKSIKALAQPALKVAGLFGTVGGFVADVLSPIGPFVLYLLYLSIFILIISLLITTVISKEKKELFKSISITAFFFSLIFGVFGQVNKGHKNGYLGENIGIISQFQSSLSLIDEKLENISTQVADVDEKIGGIDTKLDEGFINLANLIETSNPIENPSTPKDYILNAYLFKNGGDLQKSENSFLKFFELTGKYHIDVMYDFIKVIENNKGYNYVKVFFETNDSEDKVFNMYKLIFSKKSKDLSLLEKIKTSKLDQNLIDFAVVYLTNDVDFYMKIVSSDLLKNYTFPIENIFHIIRLKENGISELGDVILNKSRFNDLIAQGYGASASGRSLLEFYFTAIDISLNGMMSSGIKTIEESSNKEKAAFLFLISSSSNKRVELPDDWDYSDPNKTGDIANYFIKIKGEKYYLGSPIPTELAFELYDKWAEARSRLKLL